MSVTGNRSKERSEAPDEEDLAFEAHCVEAARRRLRFEADYLGRHRIAVEEVGLRGWPRATDLTIRFSTFGRLVCVRSAVWHPIYGPIGAYDEEAVASMIWFHIMEAIDMREFEAWPAEMNLWADD